MSRVNVQEQKYLEDIVAGFGALCCSPQGHLAEPSSE